MTETLEQMRNRCRARDLVVHGFYGAVSTLVDIAEDPAFDKLDRDYLFERIKARVAEARAKLADLEDPALVEVRRIEA